MNEIEIIEIVEIVEVSERPRHERRLKMLVGPVRTVRQRDGRWFRKHRHRHHHHPHPIDRKGFIVAFQCGDHQEFDLAISEVDAAGNPTGVISSVTFTSSDETILVVVQNTDDQTQAVVTAVGALGSATISVEADALTGSLDVDVITEAATGINLAPTNLREKA